MTVCSRRLPYEATAGTDIHVAEAAQIMGET